MPANLSIPKSLVQQPKIKIKMTQVEKDEFDVLKTRALTLNVCFGMVNDFGYPHLDKRLNGDNKIGQNNLAQNEFARAWADESLIEVIPDRKRKVKVPRSDESYYFKDKIDGKAYLTTVSVDPKNTNGALFTDEELKQFGLDDNLFEKVEVTDNEQ